MKAIVLKKYPLRERDLVVQFLSESGHLFSALAYGGSGGGPKHKGSLFQYGSALGLVVKSKLIGSDQELVQIKEKWEIWSPHLIGQNYRAFELMSFVIKLISQVARPIHWEDADLEEAKGTYRVLSNALFHLNESIKLNDFHHDLQLLTFLAKLSFELGLTPDFRFCGHCRREIKISEVGDFSRQEGHFICFNCVEGTETQEVIRALWQIIARSWDLPYRNFRELKDFYHPDAIQLLKQHIGHHLGIHIL